MPLVVIVGDAMKSKIQLRPVVRKILGDTITPVSAYLRLRSRFPGTCLLESADYQPDENCFTYLCIRPLAEFRVHNGCIIQRFPGQPRREAPLSGGVGEIEKALRSFKAAFDVSEPEGYDIVSNGLFGYISYDAIEHFEDISLTREADNARRVPSVYYQVFEYLVAINHYRNEIYILRNRSDAPGFNEGPALDEIERIITDGVEVQHGFSTDGDETSNMTDGEHLQIIERCKKHIKRGDVFQIVPSRRFDQPYRGDDFNVYRALRVINPSPYLFYFEFGDFRIFGSSPEAQLIVSDGRASIFPIAGTCPRTGDDTRDQQLIDELVADPKENAEHVMLVDLARNDLSIRCEDVQVDTYKEVQKFSHVIHLVSKVSGQLNDGIDAIELLADTFPAGTLSGAPKYRAIELIDTYERSERGVYAGAIGFLGFCGSCNHAIIIRSFLSKNNILYRQAGAGIVADSVPQKEVDEVRSKLGALKKALVMAGEI